MVSGRKREYSGDNEGGDHSELQGLLDSLMSVSFPSKDADKIFDKVKTIVKKKTIDEASARNVLSCILRKAHSVHRSNHNIFGSLIKHVMRLHVGASTFTVQSLVANICSSRPTLSEKSLSDFLATIPFLEELYREKIIGRKPIFSLAQYFQRIRIEMSLYASLCSFEMLKIVDSLISENLYTMVDGEETVWGECANRLVKECRKDNVDSVKAKEILEFIQRIEQDGGWLKKTSRIVNNDNTPAKSIIADKMTSSVLPATRSTKANPFPVRIDSEMTPAFRNSLFAMSRTVEELAAKPKMVDVVAAKIRRSLQSRNEGAYRDSIFAILTLACDASLLHQATLVELLMVLEKNFAAQPPVVIKSKKPLHVRVLVSSWAMQLRRLSTEADLAKFHNSLRLLNALYRRRLVMSWIFKYYADHAVSSQTEISMLALYEVLMNVDMLSDLRVWKYKEDEAAFFEECCCSLAVACQSKVVTSHEKVTEISAFLASIPQKGGWHRASVAKYLRKSQAAQQAVENQEPLVESEDEEAVAAVTTAIDNSSEAAAGENEDENDGEHEEKDEEEEMEMSKEKSELIEPETNDRESPVEPERAGKETPVDMTDLPSVTESASTVKETPLQRLDELLKILAKTPENWPTIASEIESLITSLKSETALDNAASLIIKTISDAEAEIFPVYVHLLESLHEVTITTKKGRNYSLRKAFTSSVMQVPKLKKSKHLDVVVHVFRVLNELLRLKLVKSTIFRNYLEQTKVGDEVLKYLLVFEILRNIDGLIDAGIWQFGNHDDDGFWSKTCERFSSKFGKRLADHERLEEVSTFIQEVEKKGGWLRPIKRKEQSEPKKSPGGDECEERHAVVHAKFCAFLDNDFLKGRVMNSVKFLKSTLLSMSSPCLFTEALELILDKAFELNHDHTTLDSAVKLCSELNQVENEGGKNLIAVLQEKCVKLLSASTVAENEAATQKLLNETTAAEAPQEQMILAEKYEKMELAEKKKYIGCARLIGRLFLEKQLSFNFFLSFVDSLLSLRTDNMLEGLLEVLLVAGKDFEEQLQSLSMSLWWSNFINELTRISQNVEYSAKKRTIASEILAAKSSGWPVPTVEQELARRFRILLLELTPGLVRTPIKYNAVLNRVRAFFTECPPEHCQALFEVFFCEYQNCLSDLAQVHQYQLPMMMYPYGNMPWQMPANGGYYEPLKVPENPATTARVVSVTSITP